MRSYVSIKEARQAFEPFARLEPKLWTLWDICRCAAPPPRRAAPLDDADDAYDVDPFEIDVLADDEPDDGWCAEDCFLHDVKSRLLALVGAHRTRGPHELQTSEAYDTVYDILLHGALARPCGCCAEVDDAAPGHRAGDGHPAPW
jgi:hypothetical protein